MVADGYAPPRGLEQWAELSRSEHPDREIRALYYLAGLRFQGRRGGKTQQNFPGAMRLMILPLEALARLRWRFHITRGFAAERSLAKALFRLAAARKARSLVAAP
jgi:hypothetical protein